MLSQYTLNFNANTLMPWQSQSVKATLPIILWGICSMWQSRVLATQSPPSALTDWAFSPDMAVNIKWDLYFWLCPLQVDKLYFRVFFSNKSYMHKLFSLQFRSVCWCLMAMESLLSMAALSMSQLMLSSASSFWQSRHKSSPQTSSAKSAQSSDYSHQITETCFTNPKGELLFQSSASCCYKDYQQAPGCNLILTGHCIWTHEENTLSKYWASQEV